MDVNNNFDEPTLVLFPDGLLLPSNIDALFSIAEGITLKSLRKCLVGSYVLSCDYNLLEIGKVTERQETFFLANLVKGLFFKKFYFDVDAKVVSEGHLAIINLFKDAALDPVNLENNVLRVTRSEFLAIDRLEGLYRSFKYPDLVDCLDRL